MDGIKNSTFYYTRSEYIPFETLQECWNEMNKHQPFGYVKEYGLYEQIMSVAQNEVMIPDYEDGYIIHDFENAFKQLTFADGTPFGKLIK